MIIIKYVEAALLSLMFCINLIFFENNELLKKITQLPERRELYIQEENLSPQPQRCRGLLMDIYRPSPPKRVRSKMLIIHGATEFGKDDIRLVRICELLARLGFELYVPNIRELMEWQIGTSGVDDIVYIYKKFLQPEKRLSKGLLSYSTGCAVLFLAASVEEISSDIDYLISFGGYYDTKNILLFMTTGFYNESGVWKKCPQEKMLNRIFLKKNLNLVKEEEREIVSLIIDRGPEDELMDGLTSESRALVELLYNDDKDRFYQLYDKIDHSVKRLFQQSSPRYYLDKIKADCFIAHSVPDFVIPHTESKLLAEALKDKVRGYYTFRFFHHVERKFRDLDLKKVFLVYIPDIIKFYRFIFRMLIL